MNLYEQQQTEIETIRERTITVNLSDSDCDRLARVCGEHGLTIGELIENFVGDLVGGTYTNGSTEREFAKQWFERCWFGMFPETTFLGYLIDEGLIDEVVEALEDIEYIQKCITETETFLATGKMCRSGKCYTWKDVVDSTGTQCYASQKEWEQDEKLNLQAEQEDMLFIKGVIDSYWMGYCDSVREDENQTLDDEIERIKTWIKQRDTFVNHRGGKQ